MTMENPQPVEDVSPTKNWVMVQLSTFVSGGCFFIRAFTVFFRQKSDLLRLVEKKSRHQLWSHIARPLLHLGMKHADFYGKTGLVGPQPSKTGVKLVTP